MIKSGSWCVVYSLSAAVAYKCLNFGWFIIATYLFYSNIVISYPLLQYFSIFSIQYFVWILYINCQQSNIDIKIYTSVKIVIESVRIKGVGCMYTYKQSKIQHYHRKYIFTFRDILNHIWFIDFERNIFFCLAWYSTSLRHCWQ